MNRHPKSLLATCGLLIPVCALASSAAFAQPQPVLGPGTTTTVVRPQPIDLRRPLPPVARQVLPDNITLITIHEPDAKDADRVSKNKKLSKEEFAKLIKNPSVKVVTDKSIAKSMKNSAEVRAAIREQFAKNFAATPQLAALAKVKPSPKSGEFLLTAKNAKGQPSHIMLLSPDALMRDVVATHAYTDNAKHQAGEYERAFKLVAASTDKKAKDRLAKLPKPEDVARLTAAEINRHFADLVSIWVDIFKPTPGAGKPALCKDEEGAGYGGDMTGDPAPGFSSTGLFAQCSWPLKNYNTCVRNQGNRGSCVAFCVAGAVESKVALQDNRFVNLSEQDLYKHFRLDWSPPSDTYLDDGYSSVVGLLGQMVTFYRFPFERDWDYNPSYSRNDNTFAHSCDSYNGGPCSNTSHQANRVCYSVDTTVAEEVTEDVCEFVETIPIIGGFLGEWVCEPVTKFIDKVKTVEVCAYEANIPGTSSYRVTGFVPFYDPIIGAQNGVNLAKFYLGNAHPVSLGAQVSEDFSDAATAAGGFVQESTTTGAIAGGHCMLITGFVDNANLPAGAAPGGGGGYFIVKNSWGNSFGDNGYVYLSYDWVKHWATSMAAVTGVGR